MTKQVKATNKDRHKHMTDIMTGDKTDLSKLLRTTRFIDARDSLRLSILSNSKTFGYFLIPHSSNHGASLPGCGDRSRQQCSTSRCPGNDRMTRRLYTDWRRLVIIIWNRRAWLFERDERHARADVKLSVNTHKSVVWIAADIDEQLNQVGK